MLTSNPLQKNSRILLIMLLLKTLMTRTLVEVKPTGDISEKNDYDELMVVKTVGTKCRVGRPRRFTSLDMASAPTTLPTKMIIKNVCSIIM